MADATRKVIRRRVYALWYSWVESRIDRNPPSRKITSEIPLSSHMQYITNSIVGSEFFPFFPKMEKLQNQLLNSRIDYSNYNVNLS